MSAVDFGVAPSPAIPFIPPVRYDPTQLQYCGKTLLEILESPDYKAQVSAAMIAAEIEQHPPTSAVITVYGKTYKPIGEINDYVALKVIFPRNRIGTATIVLKGTEPMYAALVNCWQTVVPITIDIGGLRWSGRVFSADDSMHDRVNTLTLQCKDDYTFLDKILCWPAPELPIEAQFPSRALYIGPAITCIKTLIAEQALRLQSGIWELVNNLGSLDLDWQSWFGTLLESTGSEGFGEMLSIPVVVVPTDPITDTSQWCSISGRMDKCSTLIEQVVADLGLNVTCSLWMPGDPQPAGLSTELAWPCIVVDVRDNENVTGPTGTFLDGIVEDVVDLQHSLLGNVLSPFLNPDNEYAPQGINIAPLIGVNFTKPWTLFTDSNRSGLREYHVVFKHPDAYTVVGGGKSPKWIDDLINETLEWLVDSITIAIGISGIPSDFLDGTFDDIILAFQQIENAERRSALGPYAWPEFFVQTGASAFTLDEWFALQGAMWDTRGYPMFTLKFDNGFPYQVGKDIFPGQLVSFARRGQLLTDYVDSVTFTDDRKNRARVDMVVGDILPMQNPMVKIQRRLNEFEAAFNIITLSSN